MGSERTESKSQAERVRIVGGSEPSPEHINDESEQSPTHSATETPVSTGPNPATSGSIDLNSQNAEATSTVHLSLDVSPELNRVLESLATQAGVEKSEVLRRAIVLMGVAAGAKQEGMKFGIADSDRHLITEITGL